MAKMKVQSVRFGDWQWQAIARAAAEDGTSASQFIRAAAFARALLMLLQAGYADEAFAGPLAESLRHTPDVAAVLRDALARIDADA